MSVNNDLNFSSNVPHTELLYDLGCSTFLVYSPWSLHAFDVWKRTARVTFITFINVNRAERTSCGFCSCDWFRTLVWCNVRSANESAAVLAGRRATVGRPAVAAVSRPADTLLQPAYSPSRSSNLPHFSKQREETNTSIRHNTYTNNTCAP